PRSWCITPAGAAPDRITAGGTQPAGGYDDGVCRSITRVGDLTAAGTGGHANRGDLYLASVRAGFGRARDGDGDLNTARQFEFDVSGHRIAEASGKMNSCRYRSGAIYRAHQCRHHAQLMRNKLRRYECYEMDAFSLS
ncbi:unnamed protein product, partial [Allacma fusca]